MGTAALPVGGTSGPAGWCWWGRIFGGDISANMGPPRLSVPTRGKARRRWVAAGWGRWCFPGVRPGLAPGEGGLREWGRAPFRGVGGLSREGRRPAAERRRPASGDGIQLLGEATSSSGARDRSPREWCCGPRERGRATGARLPAGGAGAGAGSAAGSPHSSLGRG